MSNTPVTVKATSAVSAAVKIATRPPAVKATSTVSASIHTLVRAFPRLKMVTANLKSAVTQFYALWSNSATLDGSTVYFSYAGTWCVAPTGSESSIGYYSYAPLNVAYANEAALFAAAVANAVDAEQEK